MAASSNPLDIDGKNFDCDSYLSKLLKEETLTDLIRIEKKFDNEVRALDSEMQTLVYENYNKFITATDTIRKMKTDFVKMEEEMDKLVRNMEQITESSSQVTNGLGGRRKDVQRLVKASGTLKQLEFLFKLPASLQSHVQQKDYAGAVRSYQKARTFLDKFENVPAFRGISADCNAIIADLKDQLKDSFRGSLVTGKELVANVGYLIQLDEQPETLAQEYLNSAISQLKLELQSLQKSSKVELSEHKQHLLDIKDQLDDLQALLSFFQASKGTVERRSSTIAALSMDILEFVDSDCSSFLSNLGLMIASCNELFPQIQLKNLNETIDQLLKEFLDCMEQRFLSEDGSLADGSLLNRALDRFYRRIQSTNRLLPQSAKEYDKLALQIVFNVSRKQTKLSADAIKKRFDNSLSEIRQRLATAKNIARVQQGSAGEPVNQPLADLLTKLEQNVVHDLKSSLANLLQTTAPDLSFINQQPKFVFRYGFVVRSELVVDFFNYVARSCRDLSGSQNAAESKTTAVVAPTLLLLLGKFCQNLSSSTVGYVLDLCEQQFRISQLTEKGAQLPPNFVTAASLAAKLKQEAQFLIDQFVVLEGFSISQMLVKSVETRDWLGCIEPKSVRAVMKRVVEDLTAIDWRLSQFLEEGKRQERSSDSSRRTSALHSKHVANPNLNKHWSNNSANNYADNAISNTLGKLWTERIDYFTSVDFTKVSVMTGIIKICLKTLLESVRLRTFGKFGLQQVQVDSHYLQMLLWRFVSDENIVNTLLDEVVSSAVHRCVESQLMDPSIVEVICDRG